WRPFTTPAHRAALRAYPTQEALEPEGQEEGKTSTPARSAFVSLGPGPLYPCRGVLVTAWGEFACIPCNITAVRSIPRPIGGPVRVGDPCRAQSFSSGAYLTKKSFSPMSAPKSMRALVLSPPPSTSCTRPMPKESWVTRSPTVRVGASFFGARQERPFPMPRMGEAASAGSVRRHSTSSEGTSVRKREGGL